MSDGAEAHVLALACAQAMLARDRTAAAFGIRLEHAAPGEAALRMNVDDIALNGHATAHGGAIFTLADTAFAVACNSRDVPHVALDASISFVSAGRLGDVLRATARERSLGGRTGVYDVEIRNARDELVAVFRGTAYRVAGSVIAGPMARPADGTAAVSMTIRP